MKRPLNRDVPNDGCQYLDDDLELTRLVANLRLIQFISQITTSPTLPPTDFIVEVGDTTN